MVAAVAPSFRPPLTGSTLSFLQEKNAPLVGVRFSLVCESLLSCEEGQSGQQTDRVGSTAAEAMIVVCFQACGEPTVREWKLEAHSDPNVPGIRAIATGHTDSGDANERPQVKTFADSIAVGNEQKAGFQIVSRNRVATATDRIDAEPRLELELVTEEIAQAEYLRWQGKQSAARITNSERQSGVDSQLDSTGAVSR